MGLFKKKDQIVCGICHVKHDKLLKNYLSEIAKENTMHTPVGSFHFVNWELRSKLNEMLRCDKCGGYFCKKCSKKAEKKSGKFGAGRYCPSCQEFIAGMTALKEYTL